MSCTPLTCREVSVRAGVLCNLIVTNFCRSKMPTLGWPHPPPFCDYAYHIDLHHPYLFAEFALLAKFDLVLIGTELSLQLSLEIVSIMTRSELWQGFIYGGRWEGSFSPKLPSFPPKMFMDISQIAGFFMRVVQNSGTPIPANTRNYFMTSPPNRNF